MNALRSIWLWGIFFSTMVTAPAAGLRADDAQAAGGPQVKLQTVYLSDPVGRAHRIIIEGELGGPGKLTLEGNTCTTSQFGDTQICTRVFFPPQDVKLVQLRLADPTGAGRRIYRLDGMLEPAGYRYYVIVPRRRSGAHRLVVDLEADERRVISLEALPQNDEQGKPELCKSAKYRARQEDGKVTIYATGEHPTTAWKTRFEQLPIKIYPPQYRLVCVRPSGIVGTVITPFKASTSFDAKTGVKQVVVHDAKGQHKIPVEHDDQN